MEDDVLVAGGARCSSTDSLGESIPKELIVEDLPLLCRYARVGDECPECLELGRKNADAGDALDLENKLRLDIGGVETPFLDDGREGVGVSWEFDRDREGDGDLPDDPGTGAWRDELETSVDEAFPLVWRCAIGNNGSGCLRFLRGSLKNVVVVWTV